MISISEKVIKESLVPSGTWSMSFLTETINIIKKMKEEEIIKNYEIILEKMIDNTSTNLVKFKLAQFLSASKNSLVSGCDFVLLKYKEVLLNWIFTLDSYDLLIPTKDLIQGFYFPKKNIISTPKQFRSFSHQPFQSINSINNNISQGFITQKLKF